MPIRIYLLLTLIIPAQLLATNYAPSGWHWQTFPLHRAIGFTGMEDELINPEHLKSSLEACVQNLSRDSGCNYASMRLILISKMDSQSTITISIANRLFAAIPNDYQHDLYYIREYAARALARRGLPDKLLEVLVELDDNGEPSLDEALLMAEAKDYRWSDMVLGGLKTDANLGFCNTTLFVRPFLSSDHSDRQLFIDALTNAVMAETSYHASCAIYILFNIPSTAAIETSMRTSMATLLNSSNSEWHETGGLLTDKWPISIGSDQALIARMIQIAASSDNNSSKFYLNYTIKSLGIVAKLFVRSDPQETWEKGNITSSSSRSPTFGEYMESQPYNEVWLMYANEMKFTDMQSLLVGFESSVDTIVDLEQKLLYFKNSNLIMSHKYLKSNFADLAVRANAPFASQLLNELYTSADGLQKNAMIARYPQQFASKPVVRVNTNNSWIKLAELTNLLTICKIETPPVGTELSDPEKLTKYLEDAEILIKDCSRVNK